MTRLPTPYDTHFTKQEIDELWDKFCVKAIGSAPNQLNYYTEHELRLSWDYCAYGALAQRELDKEKKV
jgi:hypothetical protein